MPHIAYKYRLYPTALQRELLAKTFGCCRKVYNLMLADKIRHYQETGEMLQTTPAQYKTEYPFLKEVDSLALANEQLHLQTAYKNFFRDPKVGFPKFKSKRCDSNSYTTNLISGNIRILDKQIKLPKLGLVKARVHRAAPADYKLKSVTVSQERDGSYYAAVLYEYEETLMPAQFATHIGLDYASHGLYVDSNGEACDMPGFYRKAQKHLAKLQRRASRKQKDSSNRRKANRHIARLARHVANQRKDFLHKKSTEITNQYDIISVEDLNMHGMAQSLRLGKATLDNGYGMFLNMLQYKQERLGHQLIRIGKHFPSSQLCQCGYQNPVTKDLAVRKVTCPRCGRSYDRDHNAAINIDREGYRIATAA